MNHGHRGRRRFTEWGMWRGFRRNENLTRHIPVNNDRGNIFSRRVKALAHCSGGL